MAFSIVGQPSVRGISRGKLNVQAFRLSHNANICAELVKHKQAAAPATQQKQAHVQQQHAAGALQRPQHPANQQQQSTQQGVPHYLPLPGAVGSVVQQQQQQLLPAPFCVLDAPVLTHRIKQCSCWVDVAVLFAKQSQCMNAINLSALLTHLAHLDCSPSNRPVNWRTFITQVLAASEPQLSLCEPRQLANMAWALASLGFSSWVQRDCSWSQLWQQQLQQSLPRASCRDVTNILWALATSVSSGGTSNSCRRQSLVMQHPEHLLQARLQQQLLSALHRTLSKSSPQDVSNALWSLATLQLQPSPELGQYLLIRAQTHFQALKPQEVASTLWAVGQLQLQPSTAWLQELLLRQVGRRQWDTTNVQHQVMCLVACAHAGHVPPDKWIAQTLQQLDKQLLLPLLIRHQQQQQCQQAAVSSSEARSSSDQEHQRGAASSGSSQPTVDQLRSSNSSSNVTTSKRHAQDLANTVWALGVFRIRPSATWLQHYFAASLPSLAASGPQELSSTLWGLARLKTPLDAGWLEGYDAASLAAMRKGVFSAQGLADVLASQVHLNLQPSGIWKEEWMVALRRVWRSADASAVCKTLWAAAKFRLPLGRSWLQQALQEAHGEVHDALVRQDLSVEELLRLMYAVGRLCRGYLTQDMSDMLGLYCCRTASKMTWQQLQRGAWGLARLKPLPSMQLVGYFAELAECKVKYMPQDQAIQVEEKLKLLKHAAEVACMHAAVLQAMQGAATAYTHQQVVDAGASAHDWTAAAPGSSVAACAVTKVQAELKDAQLALQQAQEKVLLKHQLQLQHKLEQPPDQMAVQHVA